jgi:hypothetical protein
MLISDVAHCARLAFAFKLANVRREKRLLACYRKCASIEQKRLFGRINYVDDREIFNFYAKRLAEKSGTLIR